MNDYLPVFLIILFVLFLLGADDILDALLSSRRRHKPKPAARPCKHDWRVAYTRNGRDFTPAGVVCSKCKKQQGLATGDRQTGTKTNRKGVIALWRARK